MNPTEYSLKLENLARQVIPGSRSAISQFLENRSIRNILHFTHVSNLISILTNGLKSRISLEIEQMTFHKTDLQRRDEILQGICCSLAYPNIWMLNNKHDLDLKNYVILEIMENAMLLPDHYFVTFPGNAADQQLKNDAKENPELYVGISGLKRMFLNHELRQKESIPKYVPTDLQAEIIFFNKIDKDRIRKIHFPGPKSEAQQDIFETIQISFPKIGTVFESKSLFYKKVQSRGHDGRKFRLDWT